MKKIILILLIALVITGCGSSNEDNSESDYTGSNKENTTIASDGITIEYDS